MQPASEEEQAESDERIRGFFSKVAGEDLEIDWSELQNVLNYAMKRGALHFTSLKGNVSSVMLSGHVLILSWGIQVVKCTQMQMCPLASERAVYPRT